MSSSMIHSKGMSDSQVKSTVNDPRDSAWAKLSCPKSSGSTMSILMSVVGGSSSLTFLVESPTRFVLQGSVTTELELLLLLLSHLQIEMSGRASKLLLLLEWSASKAFAKR